MHANALNWTRSNYITYYTIITYSNLWAGYSSCRYCTTQAALFVVHQLLNASPGSLRLSGAFHLLSWRRRERERSCSCSCLRPSGTGLSGSLATLAWKIEINVLLIMPWVAAAIQLPTLLKSCQSIRCACRTHTKLPSPALSSACSCSCTLQGGTSWIPHSFILSFSCDSPAGNFVESFSLQMAAKLKVNLPSKRAKLLQKYLSCSRAGRGQYWTGSGPPTHTRRTHHVAPFVCVRLILWLSTDAACLSGQQATRNMRDSCIYALQIPCSSQQVLRS